jgi:hypothetical protein
MFRKFLGIFILFSVTVGYAKSIEELVKAFQEKKFKIVCQQGMKKFNNGNRDENLLGMIGVACAEIDYINPLADLQKYLRSTKAGRNNASYFATLILQKKLFYQFMLDDIDLGYLRVPDTNHILSVIFRNLVLKNYTIISKKPKKIEIEDDGKLIKIYVKNTRPKKVIVDIYQDGRKISSHWYR